MRQFADLRERHDLRRIQRPRARHFLQLNSLQCRAETITAERSVILLIGCKHSGLLVIGRMGFPEGLGTGPVASLV